MLRSTTRWLVRHYPSYLVLLSNLTIAGRVNTRGFIRSIHDSKYRDTASSNLVPSRPDEVIFRRKNAPIRYEETDFYYAHESLPPDCPLPSSELLVAIHAYAADFYHHTTRNHGRHDRESMNDTALIAMGILIEEMAKESLGKTGDLVLVEGEDVSDDEHEKVPLSQADRSRGLKRRRPGHFTAPGILGNDLDDVVQKIRQPKSGRKRRKVLREAPTETITLDDG